MHQDSVAGTLTAFFEDWAPHAVIAFGLPGSGSPNRRCFPAHFFEIGR